MPATHDDTLRNMLKRTNVGGGSPQAVTPATAPQVDEAEPDALTISQMDGKYSSLRPANKPLTRLHVVDKAGKVRTFQYHFLDVESTFDGGTFTLTFAGTKNWQITVKGHGPRFWAVYDYCTTHRWPYLREATGSMPGANPDGETVFTEIKIQDVTPKDRE